MNKFFFKMQFVESEKVITRFSSSKNRKLKFHLSEYYLLSYHTYLDQVILIRFSTFPTSPNMRIQTKGLPDLTSCFIECKVP